MSAFTTGAFIRLVQGINRSVIRQSIILIVKLMSFKTSVLIWFSRSLWYSLTPSPSPTERGAPNGVRLLCKIKVLCFGNFKY